MGLDYSHQHSSADIMQADDPHTPISPSGSSIAATDEQIVFMDGTDAVGSDDLRWHPDGVGIGDLRLGSVANGTLTIQAVGAGSQLLILAADGDETHVGGEMTIATGGSDGQSSGGLSIATGADGGGGDSGDINIGTGRAVSGKSGDIGLYASPAGSSAEGGNINIVAGTGQSSNGGDVIIQAGAKVAGGSHGSIQLYEGSGNNSIEMNASGLFVFGGIVILDSLPTADPGNAGQIYSDGVPSAGVPKALMVSGG